MRYASTTATLALLLAVTSTLAAPVPELIPSPMRTRETTETVHHEHTNHHHHHHHRVSLAKWIHDHLHYPQHWPFHPHHETQSHHHHHDHVAEHNERPKKSGSMLLFWLHSHFAPHTSKLRTHRGKPISDMNRDQRVLSSSFDDKPPSEEDALEARDLETQSTPESEGEGSRQLHHQLKEFHKAGHELHKLGKVNDAVEKMHLRIGLAAAKLGHMGEHHDRRGIDELD